MSQKKDSSAPWWSDPSESVRWTLIFILTFITIIVVLVAVVVNNQIKSNDRLERFRICTQTESVPWCEDHIREE